MFFCIEPEIIISYIIKIVKCFIQKQSIFHFFQIYHTVQILFKGFKRIERPLSEAGDFFERALWLCGAAGPVGGGGLPLPRTGNQLEFLNCLGPEEPMGGAAGRGVDGASENAHPVPEEILPTGGQVFAVVADANVVVALPVFVSVLAELRPFRHIRARRVGGVVVVRDRLAGRGVGVVLDRVEADRSGRRAFGGRGAGRLGGSAGDRVLVRQGHGCDHGLLGDVQAQGLGFLGLATRGVNELLVGPPAQGVGHVVAQLSREGVGFAVQVRLEVLLGLFHLVGGNLRGADQFVVGAIRLAARLGADAGLEALLHDIRRAHGDLFHLLLFFVPLVVGLVDGVVGRIRARRWAR